MNNTKNAMAELAERLKGKRGTFTYEYDRRDIVKAQLIIAELAKVSDGGWYDFGHGDKTFICKSPMFEIGNVIGNCRVIAEEEVNER